ncbi:Fmt Methionyl-tRNA formyltransferase [Candidatus Nanopelagicaceae bacterium]
MRLCVAATPKVAIPTLDYLLLSNHELISVITQPDRPSGRGQKSRESEVSQWAAQNNVTCHKPQGEQETLAALIDADLLLTIGYGVILPTSVISLPTHGSINLHFSLLPRWRGAAPVQRAIEAGDSVSGVTVFALDEGMDTGPIYLEKRFALDADITSDELLNELADLGVEAVAQTLTLIEQGVRPHAQSMEGATRAMKISKGDAQIDWNQSAEAISQKIRAFTSNPGAWTNFRESTLKVFTPTVTDFPLPPGELLLKEKKLYIGTSTFALEIGEVQPSGKALMPASSWVNGVRLDSGERFG